MHAKYAGVKEETAFSPQRRGYLFYLKNALLLPGKCTDEIY
jgi:hypothetical protein